MTGFASQRLPCPVGRAHAFGKFAFVNIFVTGRAIQLLEMIKNRSRSAGGLVAFVARNRCVTAGERKRRFLVQLQ